MKQPAYHLIFHLVINQRIPPPPGKGKDPSNSDLSVLKTPIIVDFKTKQTSEELVKQNVGFKISQIVGNDCRDIFKSS